MRVCLVWLVISCVLPVHRVFACSCTPMAQAPACQLIGRAPVAFLGSVIRDEIDPARPKSAAFRLQRFRVEAAYRGLDPKATEVVVDPDSGCGSDFRVGVRYIVFGLKMNGSSVILSGMCSGSRAAGTHPDDVEFLKRFSEGRSQTTISGSVVEWRTNIGWPKPIESAPVAGAIVSLSSDAGAISRKSDVSGHFQFGPIATGVYALSAQAANFDSSTPIQVDVSAGGCAEVFPVLDPQTLLAGRVTFADGTAAKGKRVELLRKNAANEWYSTTQFWANTNETGAYEFRKIPSGDYLVGSDIWRDRPSQYSEYPTQYFPGVAQRAQATVLHLAPRQRIEGIALRLPAPHHPRTIHVQVVWPDGTWPTRNLLQIFDSDDLLKNLGFSIPNQPPAVHNGSADIDAFQERTYKLHAIYWMDDLGGMGSIDQLRTALTGTTEIGQGKDVFVRLVLNRPALPAK